MDNQAFDALLATSIGAIGATLHIVRAMAVSGTISPDAIEELAHSLTLPFVEVDEGNPVAQKVRSSIEAFLEPHLAAARKIAEENWKSR